VAADQRGTVALVTGAAHGIGFEVCRQLAERGMTVILTARAPGKAEAAAEQLAGDGLDVRPRALDVSDDESVRALAAELEGTGILVNAVCPGLTATAPGMEAIGARPIPEGAAGVVWGATIPDDGPTGGFFRDGKPLPW
jgi:NAD(P)-dependent dehydrogenase (short-subunit alcohol dehydrogenase family)